ncbi:MAG: FAD-binding oxidoreductase, partial [Pseudomonadota bacterium]|nr:FAD-binding oxidoreductase [Pseudomonadota bacterium]
MNILFDERLDGELVRRDKAEVLSDLQGAVPSLTLLHREEDLRPFECDGLAAYRVLPMLVALPETLEQVEGLLKRCHALGV